MGSSADSKESRSNAQRRWIYLERASPATSTRHGVMGFGDKLPTLVFGVSR
jgi:hypothetical protein